MTIPHPTREETREAIIQLGRSDRGRALRTIGAKALDFIGGADSANKKAFAIMILGMEDFPGFIEDEIRRATK